MHNKKKAVCCWITLLLFMLVIAGCSDSQNETSGSPASVRLNERNKNISGQIGLESSMELQYAQKFAIDYYEGGYALISIADGGRYLIIPEGKQKPDDLKEDIVLLYQPFDNIYLVATAVMDMFRELDELDCIRFSGKKSDGWCIEEVRKKMEKGDILYAGKYNMPDYERIVSEGCSLAIENNMISHSPEVVEKLESFGIPVLIDFSSYESHPLGRVEWIKLYGVLLNKKEMAQKLFDQQCEIMNRIIENKVSEKTVAFFFITTNGMVNVRNSSDYVPKMIELAGGKYVFEDLGEKNQNRSSVTIQMEQFYNTAKDADYLIYNSTIDGELVSLEQLIKKEEMLKDFKAVKEGNVWCTTKDLYQQSMSIGRMMEDIHNILSEDTEKQKDTMYLYPLK
ncbi:MAG: ABC transporter substrate-binding protein [Clostridiales bacterium]|nr:ABC transporter substrate-binding protein [Clostridiales bacterium]